jgi:hypothetical protein
MMKLSFLVAIIFQSYFLCQAQRTPIEDQDRQWCFAAREKYGIIPGKSFGTLPFSEHNTYLKARCYRFFCKPHPLAGKGVFECEPLPDSLQLRRR